MNKIYKYDAQLKEFIQELEINEAYGINLPFTTTVKPLTKKEGFAVCFNGTKWEYVEDNRATELYHGKEKYEIGSNVNGQSYDGIGDIPEWLSTEPEPPTTEQLAEQVRAERDAKIEAVRWRIERAKDETDLGVQLTEPLEPLLQYVQALRDVPQQAGFPENVEWPTEP